MVVLKEMSVLKNCKRLRELTGQKTVRIVQLKAVIKSLATADYCRCLSDASFHRLSLLICQRPTPHVSGGRLGGYVTKPGASEIAKNIKPHLISIGGN
ncbi:hypothetical protein ACVBEH_04740 [Roseateles sp. GG27B]